MKMLKNVDFLPVSDGYAACLPGPETRISIGLRPLFFVWIQNYENLWRKSGETGGWGRLKTVTVVLVET